MSFDKKVYLEKLEKIISVVASIITIFGVIFGSLYLVQIKNQINVSNNNKADANVYIGDSDNTTMEADLYNAQNYFNQELYESTMKLCQKWKATSPAANIFIGYLYSNGLSVKKDSNMACIYYKQAYYLGEEKGLTNYLFINMSKPENYEDTLTALRFGYDKNNENVIRFLSLLIDGKMLDGCDDTQKKNAEKFWSLSDQEKKNALSKYLIEKTEYLEVIEDDKLPMNTDFKQYGKVMDNGNVQLYKDIVGYVESYNSDDGSYLWQPVYDVKYYYAVTYQSFIYADYLFAEEVIKI